MTVDISRSKTASGTASGNFTTISTPILPHNHSKACFVQDMPHETPDEFKDEAASLISPKIVSDNSILPQEVQLPAPELKESETETSDTSSRRALWNTPFEIWHEIFQYLIPPTTFLDSSLCRGPRSPWSLALCTKKILISVCKTWYNVGIHLLYQQIVLRRFPQIHSLLQSLDLNSELGPMIMDITVSCFVSSDYSPVIKSELSRLLKYCPLVSHFTFAIEPPTPLELYPPSEFLATATHMLSNITHIEFGPNVAFSDVVPHLTHCKSLISLTFDMHGQTCGNMATEAVDLPMLETLQISWHSQKRPEVDVLIVVASWSMPRLHRFTAHQTEFFVDITELYYSPFWKKYGPALSTLCVVVSRFVLWGPILGTPFNQSLLDFCPIPGTSFVQSLLKLCPNLEHLAISSPMLAEILSHKTLKWIDIWATTYRQTYERRLSAPSEVVDFMKAQDFPMLRGVRILEWALFDTTGPALHLRVPPNMIEGAESIEWLFPGVHVQHDPAHEQSDTSDSDGESTDKDDNGSRYEGDSYGENYSENYSYDGHSSYDERDSYSDPEDSSFRPFSPSYSDDDAEWESDSEED
ncbi:hypothetical protein BJ138DRAFT_1122894 [Hygrophoropsis aurantiaca]|uniref:Uncharacterized protein n=1 Tax=Hygrophoropsis aurantiaca TaxID=72124 RepID=A0ACB8APD4_9AGAM|nr:hypothetical protein BJ138DRAFT_1122894 [Hygrophoropsis aurantiaca]